MRRGITRRATEVLLDQIRTRIPGSAVRTTLIVGYPNESEAAFQSLYDFVAEHEFDRLGVFLYSQEENTTADILGDPIPRSVKEERKNAIMELQSEISMKKNLSRVGQRMRILTDRIEGDYLIGRSEFDAPEVDNEVLIPVADFELVPPAGEFIEVEITEASEYDLMARKRR
jgi:ribosomal protein S12 methylthiotransferase